MVESIAFNLDSAWFIFDESVSFLLLAVKFFERFVASI